MTGTDRRAGRIDWAIERDRVDLMAVAMGLLGPPPGRQGERGGRAWWTCPFHADANPSFTVDADKGRWKCFGCGEHGDAAALLMKLEHLTFREAVAKLTGDDRSPSWSGPTRPAAKPAPKPPPAPSGLPAAEARALVEQAEARLWSPEGAEALSYLVDERHLTPDTIRAARLGWTPSARLPSKSGGTYEVRGWVIPWHDRGRLVLIKVRQPDGSTPRYAEAFRDRPSAFPGLDAIRPGLPLVVVEGELDALLLGQDLVGLASVVTLGSASAGRDPGSLGFLSQAPRRYIATDADEAGDRAAAAWTSRRDHRARPPRPHKDWTEARRGGVNLARWWADRLAGIEPPDLFSWPELAAGRWGGADEVPGIVIDTPDPERRRAALEAHARSAAAAGEDRWLCE